MDNYHQKEDVNLNYDDHEEEQESDSDDETGEVERYWPPPLEETVELVVSQTSKTISALSFNNSGSRFSAGGHNHEVKIWDFNSIDKDRPYAIGSSQPCGQTIIKNLDYSYDDELILVVSGACQASIIAKDGLVAKQYQCPKGDQYISDMANTKGHVQMLNDGCWNPKEKDTFITCSNDSTIRIWDLNKLTQQKTVIKIRSPISGLKAVPNVCKYSRDALSIVAGCNDGSVMMWDTRRKFITTSACVKNAHLKGSEITGIDYSYNLSKLCTRSEDESCKLWDLRNLKAPLGTKSGLTTLYSTTDCRFSPDDKLVITGTSNTKQEPGHLHFISTDEPFDIKSSLDVPGTSVIRCAWHPKINHVGYSCSNGTVYVGYDNRRSLGGFLTSATFKGTKRKKYVSQRDESYTSIKKIITPHALPLFRDDHKPSFAKIRQDPKKSYKPEVPLTGTNQGGRVIPAGSTLSSYVAKNLAKPKDSSDDMDIRTRILRHAEEAEKDPYWCKPLHQDKKEKDKDNTDD